jgi:hypothetical protein
MKSPVKQTELEGTWEKEWRERIDSGDEDGGKRGGKVRNYGRQLFSLDRAEKLETGRGKGENEIVVTRS